jgi:hypothetical protein
MRKALLNAQIYIYAEDQNFWSEEIMGWIQSAVKRNPKLHVILLTSGFRDPTDPEFSTAYLCNSINHGLMIGLKDPERDRVRMYLRFGDYVLLKTIKVTGIKNDGATTRLTTNVQATDKTGKIEENHLVRVDDKWNMIKSGTNEFIVVGNKEALPGDFIILVIKSTSTSPTVGDYDVYKQSGILVHSKTTLVDDQWTCIGSANSMRRSLYTDLEHSISVLDEKEALVREYRKQLWADHFRHTAADFNDIQTSLHSWESTWGSAGPSPPRPSWLKPVKLPIDPDTPLTGNDADRYDMFDDVDSRQPWGGVLPPD